MATPILTVLVLTLGVVSAQAAVPSTPARCEAASAASVLPLVELYTSEGCDSCPPADKWLSARFPVGTSQVSVLAFHVDYWDRLGWKDRFASARYTERQYAAMRAGGETFVYTPQVRVQGKDLRDWGGTGAAERIAAARPRPARATVKLSVEHARADALEVSVLVRVAEPSLQQHAHLWLAYTDGGLVTQVKAGENRGVRLVHDHVVRALAGPFMLDGQGSLDTKLRVARPAEAGRHPALVAFVQDTRNGDVLQTLSLPLCDGL